MNHSATSIQPIAQKNGLKNPGEESAQNTPLLATPDIEAQLASVDELISVDHMETTMVPSNGSTTRYSTYAIRSMGLSSINSLAFTIFVTQVGWLGTTTGAWFFFGSMIGHGIGVITILQMNRNLACNSSHAIQGT
jgi:hypothetical protein